MKEINIQNEKIPEILLTQRSNYIGVLGKLKSFCEGKSSPIQMTRTKYTFPLSFNQEKTDHYLQKTIV